MDRRRNCSHLGVASRPSSSVAKTQFRENHTSKPFRNQFYSNHPKLSPHQSTYTAQYITPHKSHASKMSTSKISPLKRIHEDDDQTRPFKKLVEATGLEESPAFEDITSRSVSTATSSEFDLYTRRRKSQYVDIIRKKKAVVSPEHSPIRSIHLTGSGDHGSRRLV
jgi:hypothetical protein